MSNFQALLQDLVNDIETPPRPTIRDLKAAQRAAARRDAAEGGDTHAKQLDAVLTKSLHATVYPPLEPSRGLRSLRRASGTVDLLVKSLEAAEPAPSIAITAADLLAKSEAAWLAGAITGTEHSIVDASLRHGSPIESALLERIAAADAGASA